MRLLQPLITMLGFVAAAAMLLAAVLHRGSLITLDQAIELVRIGAALGLCATAGAIFILLTLRPTGMHLALICSSAVFGLACFFLPYQKLVLARQLPELSDLATNPVDPPAFRVLASPDDAFALPLADDGQTLLQRQAYPDLRTEVYAASAADVHAAVEVVLEAQHWQVIGADRATGSFEASRLSPWLGVRHELVVRVIPGAGGSTEVDARSRSAESWSGHDLGTNAAYLRAFSRDLREILQSRN